MSTFKTIEVPRFVELPDGRFIGVDQATASEMKAAIEATDSLGYRKSLRRALKWVKAGRPGHMTS